MKKRYKTSRVVDQAIEQYKNEQLSFKQLIKVLQDYPDHPIGDLVPEFRRKQQQQILQNIQLPKGAIVANLDLQAPNGSWSCKAYYEDEKFTCEDCGVEFTWTAEKQQHWFETVKGRIETGIKRCRNCYKKYITDKKSAGQSQSGQ